MFLSATYYCPQTKLGQGYIFRSMCQEFCLQEGCLVPGCVCVPGPGGVSPPGGVPGPRGVSAPGGGLVETPQGGYCCGRYASYWNAFLFANTFLIFSKAVLYPLCLCNGNDLLSLLITIRVCGR